MEEVGLWWYKPDWMIHQHKRKVSCQQRHNVVHLNASSTFNNSKDPPQTELEVMKGLDGRSWEGWHKAARRDSLNKLECCKQCKKMVSITDGPEQVVDPQMLKELIGHQ